MLELALRVGGVSSGKVFELKPEVAAGWSLES